MCTGDLSLHLQINPKLESDCLGLGLVIYWVFGGRLCQENCVVLEQLKL